MSATIASWASGWDILYAEKMFSSTTWNKWEYEKKQNNNIIQIHSYSLIQHMLIEYLLETTRHWTRSWRYYKEQNM